MKTHFKIFVRNETRDWTEEIQRKAGGAIFTAYLFDSLRATHCCELTPSYELWPLYATPWVDDDQGSLSEEIDMHAEHEVIYIHCSVLDRMDAGNFYDCGEQDIPEDEDWDKFRESEEERLRGNVMIQFPKGFTV